MERPEDGRRDDDEHADCCMGIQHHPRAGVAEHARHARPNKEPTPRKNAPPKNAPARKPRTPHQCFELIVSPTLRDVVGTRSADPTVPRTPGARESRGSARRMAECSARSKRARSPWMEVAPSVSAPWPT